MRERAEGLRDPVVMPQLDVFSERLFCALREVAGVHQYRDEVVYIFGLQRSAVAVIESGIREEAIKPWKERIQRQALAIAEEREQHAALRAENAALRAEVKRLRIALADRIRFTFKLDDKLAKIERENAALRQAGDDLRGVAEDAYVNRDHLHLEYAVKAWDAATTPRAEEIHDGRVCGSNAGEGAEADVHGAHAGGYERGIACDGPGNRDEADVVPEGGDASRALRPDGEQAEGSGAAWSEGSDEPRPGEADAAQAIASNPTDTAGEGE